MKEIEREWERESRKWWAHGEEENIIIYIDYITSWKCRIEMITSSFYREREILERERERDEAQCCCTVDGKWKTSFDRRLLNCCTRRFTRVPRLLFASAHSMLIIIIIFLSQNWNFQNVCGGNIILQNFRLKEKEKVKYLSNCYDWKREFCLIANINPQFKLQWSQWCLKG